MGTWTNNDKLHIKFGTDAATATKGGARVYPADGGLHVVDFNLTLTDLTSTSSTVLFDNVVIPAKAWVEKIDIKCVVAATSSGSGAKLNLGLKKLDRSTEGDYDGLLDSVAQTDMDAINETATKTVVTSGGGGALMGAPAAYPGLISGYYETEAFTAGQVNIRIFYRMSANVSGSANDTIS